MERKNGARRSRCSSALAEGRRWVLAGVRAALRRKTVSLAAVVVLGMSGWLWSRPTTYDAGALAPIRAASGASTSVRMKPGQTLESLLSSASVPSAERAAMVAAFRELASPRRLRPGTSIALRMDEDGEGLSEVTIRLNSDSTVHLRNEDNEWKSQMVRAPLTTDTLFIAGRIPPGSSLWETLTDSPDLGHMPYADRSKIVIALDGVFQWRVDFHRQVRPGDSYRVVFERQFLPDGSLRGEGRVLAAELINRDTSHRAFWFDVSGDGDGAHYDHEGKSVEGPFMLRPVEYLRISSRVRRRFHPILKTWRAHNGVDYAAAAGTPVMATANGTVVRRGWSGGYGNLIELRHSDGFTTRYAHLSSFEPGLTVGSHVRQGERIGRVGMTGLATGPHLHYELHRNGRVLDPLDVRFAAGDPIPASAWSRWEAHLAYGQALLDSPPLILEPEAEVRGRTVVLEMSEDGD